MPNGNDKWSQYAVPNQSAGGAASTDKWQQYAVSQPGAAPAPAITQTEQQLNEQAAPWSKISTPGGWWEQAKGIPGAIGQGLKNIPAGVAGLAETVTNPYGAAVKAAPAMAEQVQKAREDWQRPGAFNKASAVARGAGIATAPFGGMYAIEKGEQAGRGDILPAAAEVGTTLGAPKVGAGLTRATTSFMLNLRAAAAGLDTARAINDGKVGTVTELVRKPIARYQAAKNAKIGEYAQNAIQQDQLNLQMNSQQGTINAAAAAQKAMDAAGKLDTLDARTLKLIQGAQEGAPNPNGTGTGVHNLNSIKNLASNIGSTVASLRNAGKFREAYALDGLYNDIHDLSQQRANDIGQGDQWKAYIAHTKDLKQLENGYVEKVGTGPDATYKSAGGILGDLLHEPNHAKALRTLTNEDRASEVGQMRDKIAELVGQPASDSIRQGMEIGKQLEANTEQLRNMFIGKLRGMMKYPFQVGPAAVAASYAGRASGIPGMTFILPLIVAGKVAGLLDRAAVGSLLREMKAAMPAESMQPYMQTPGSPPPNPPQQPIGPSPAGGLAPPAAGGGAGAAAQPPATPPAAGGPPRANVPPSPFGGGNLAQQLGLIERPPSAPGLVSFQDATTGGSIEMKEGFTPEQLQQKVAEHRASIDVENLDPMLRAGKVARARAKRGK